MVAQPYGARVHEATPFLVRLRDALQGWPEQGVPADAEGLHFAVEALLARTPDEPQRRMLWVASMAASALLPRGPSPASNPTNARFPAWSP